MLNLKKKLIAGVVSLATITSVGMFALQSQNVNAGATIGSCSEQGSWLFKKWVVTAKGSSVYVKFSNSNTPERVTSGGAEVYGKQPEGISFHSNGPWNSCPTTIFN